MALSVYTDGLIALNGRQTGLAVTQAREGTIVFRPAQRHGPDAGRGYQAYKMPQERYSLAHSAPTSGQAGLAQFERDLRALLASIASGTDVPLRTAPTPDQAPERPETHTERIARQIDERLMREREQESDAERALRLAKTPEERAAAQARVSAQHRMQHFDKNLRKAKRKLADGKPFDRLHRHEQAALADLAEMDGVDLAALVELFSKVQA